MPIDSPRKAKTTPVHYPRPQERGGRLIRQVVRFLKEDAGLKLPLSSHILIAVSGGADSVALAHLVVHYGRRIAPGSKIKLLHINHRWRGDASDQDADFVRSLGAKWGVPVQIETVCPPFEQGSDASWEDIARKQRKEIFERAVKREGPGSLVLTAHHADDLAETLLWRVFTGCAMTHGGGIVAREGVECRPFLRVRKEDLKAYLEEVRESFCQDETNFSDRFLRGRMRKTLMPEIERLFPKAMVHLVQWALAAQEKQSSVLDETQEDLHLDDIRLASAGASAQTMEVLGSLLLGTQGLRMRRSQWKTIFEKGVANPSWSGEIHLPGGWKLTCEPLQKAGSLGSSDVEPEMKRNARGKKRWILEPL